MRSVPSRRFLVCVVSGFLMLTFSNCNESSQQSPVPPKPVEFIPVMAPRGSVVLTKETMSKQEQKILAESFQKVAIVDHELSIGIAQSGDWKAMDRKVRGYLDALAENPYLYHLAQTTGNQMLSDQLLEGRIDAEKRAAISFYTDLLLRNNHPDAPLMLRALEALEGEWSAERRAQGGRSALRSAADYLAMNPCEACTGDVAVAEEIQDSKQRRLFEISTAIPRLRKMTDDLQK